MNPLSYHPLRPGSSCAFQKCLLLRNLLKSSSLLVITPNVMKFRLLMIMTPKKFVSSFSSCSFEFLFLCLFSSFFPCLFSTSSCPCSCSFFSSFCCPLMNPTLLLTPNLLLSFPPQFLQFQYRLHDRQNCDVHLGLVA